MFKKWINNIIIGLILIIFLLNQSFAVWQNTDFCKARTDNNKNPICFYSPEIIDDYLSDMSHIISLLEISNTVSNSEGIKALGEKGLQTGIGSFYTALMFSSYGIGDFFKNFKILTQDQHIVRDWVKITNYKQYITKKALEVSGKGLLNQNIPNHDEIKQYISSHKSFVIYLKGKTYKDILKFLRANQILVEKIYYDVVVNKVNKQNILTEPYSKFFTNEIYTINKEHLNNLIEGLVSAYTKDGEKIKCNKPWKDFMEAIKHIICDLGDKKATEAINRFKCNYKRLKYVLKLGGEMGNCGAVKLKEKIPKRLKFKMKVQGYGKTITSFQDFKDFVNHVKGNVGKIGSSLANMWNELKNPGKPKIYNIQKPDLEAKKEFIQKIKYITDTIIQDDNFVKANLTRVEPGEFTHSITLMFPKISKKLYDAMKKLQLIYENTATACENQSPFVGNCR